MKYPVEDWDGKIVGIGMVTGNQQLSRYCYVQSVRQLETFKRTGECRSEADDDLELMEYEEGELMLIDLDDQWMGHQVRIGRQLELPEKIEIIKVLRKNVDLFAWNPEDIIGIYLQSICLG